MYLVLEISIFQFFRNNNGGVDDLGAFLSLSEKEITIADLITSIVPKKSGNSFCLGVNGGKCRGGKCLWG